MGLQERVRRQECRRCRPEARSTVVASRRVTFNGAVKRDMLPVIPWTRRNGLETAPSRSRLGSGFGA